jgi:hypothetical protein
LTADSRQLVIETVRFFEESAQDRSHFTIISQGFQPITGLSGRNNRRVIDLILSTQDRLNLFPNEGALSILAIRSGEPHMTPNAFHFPAILGETLLGLQKGRDRPFVNTFLQRKPPAG